MDAAGRCPVVPPEVQRYIDEVKACLLHVVESQQLALEDRLSFLRELRHAYGRTGLVLSGGGSFGFWCGGAPGGAAAHGCGGPARGPASTELA
jgi:TAG lipase/steryl ester hydrolase/phospholipase A2/LPA acyltransferase